jgi:hypothetical protein
MLFEYPTVETLAHAMQGLEKDDAPRQITAGSGRIN